jgi:Leucine Rich repeat
MLKGQSKNIIIATVVILQIGLACYVTWCALGVQEPALHATAPHETEATTDGNDATGARKVYKQMLLNADEIDASAWSVEPEFFRYLSQRRSNRITYFKVPKAADDRFFGYLKGLDISHLVVTDTHVTNKCLKDIACMDSLDLLEINNLHTLPDHWKPIVGMKHLTSLRANNCALNDESLKILSAHRFHFLAFGSNSRITDAGTAFLRHQSLTIVGLTDDSSISDRSAFILSKMPTLETVELMQTRIADKGLQALGKLSNLHALNLRDTLITDAGFKSFDPPPKLEKLIILDCTKLTLKSVREFQVRHPDCIVVSNAK